MQGIAEVAWLLTRLMAPPSLPKKKEKEKEKKKKRKRKGESSDYELKEMAPRKIGVSQKKDGNASIGGRLRPRRLAPWDSKNSAREGGREE